MRRFPFHPQAPVVALFAAAGLFSVWPAVCRASIVYYSSRTTFNAAEPGLPVETFQPINQPGLIASSLSSTTNNSDFAPGNILPGITITSGSADIGLPQLFVYNGAVGNYNLSYPLILSFAPGVMAVATDVYASTGFSSSEAGTFTAYIFNGTTRIGSTTFSEAAFGQAFLGLSSDTPITSVEISFQPTTDLDWTPFVNNIAFGPVSAGPEPATVGMLAFAAILFGALGRMRR